MSGCSVAFLIVYVDDILSIGNDVEFLDSIKGYLNKISSIKASVKLLIYWASRSIEIDQDT